MPLTQAHAPAARSTALGWLRRVASFLIVMILFGWFFGWASPWAFPEHRRLGFGYGMLHGALMPLAFPSLVLGQDVPIYAVNNSGRPYKLGYIAGINVCGLVFFGSVFGRRRPAAPVVERDDLDLLHKNQLR